MEPLYQKVKEFVTREIAAGHWAAGERLPSENELVKRLGVSRMTVNRALRELSEQGVIHRTAGVGSFVAPARLKRPAQVLRDMIEEVEGAGARYQARVLSLETEPASESLAAIFRRNSGDPLFHCVVIHCADEVPVMLEDRWVNPAVAPDFGSIDLHRSSATRYLLSAAPVQRLEQTLEAITVDAHASQLLELPQAAPVLLLKRRSWAENQVASYAHLYYPGGRYQYREAADSLPHIDSRFRAVTPETLETD